MDKGKDEQVMSPSEDHDLAEEKVAAVTENVVKRYFDGMT